MRSERKAGSPRGQPQFRGAYISDKEQWEASEGFKPGRGLQCFRLLRDHLGLTVGMGCSWGRGQEKKWGGQLGDT